MYFGPDRVFKNQSVVLDSSEPPVSGLGCVCNMKVSALGSDSMLGHHILLFNSWPHPKTLLPCFHTTFHPSDVLQLYLWILIYLLSTMNTYYVFIVPYSHISLYYFYILANHRSAEPMPGSNHSIVPGIQFRGWAFWSAQQQWALYPGLRVREGVCQSSTL